jgi:hypothetical protein
MGAFFTSVQVRAADPEAGLREAAATVCQLATDQGMAVVEGGEDSDRHVVLVAGQGWVSVYDEATEDQDPAVLDALGMALSAALDAPAVSVLVHDSDSLLLGLYVEGQRVDRYDSAPGLLEGALRKLRPGPHRTRWRQVLPEAGPELERVFGSTALFAEAGLEPLSAALGLPLDRLSTGYRYLGQQLALEGLPHVCRLAFRQRERPAWEEPAEGLPRLRTLWEQAEELHGHEAPADAVVPLVAAVGGEVQGGLTTRNLGGAGRGLRVEVESAPGLVQWERAELVLGLPQAGDRAAAALVPTEAGWAAEFPEAAIPPGQADAAALPVGPGALRRAMAAQFATQVHANVHGRGLAPGRGALTVRLAPLDHPGQGTHWTVPLELRTTEGRPLRAPATLPPQALEPLESDAVLVALVVVEPDRVVAAARALGAAVAAHLPTRGKAALVRFPQPTGPLAAGRPRQSRPKAQGVLDGKPWAKALDELGAAWSQVGLEWPGGLFRRGPSTGISVGQGILPSPGSVSAVAVGLVGGEGADEAVARAIDGLAAGGGLHQALLTRWGAPASLEATPYELAVGVHGQCTLERSWVGRWLRAVGAGRLWLGPALQQHVALDALRAVAEVEQQGEVLAVAVEDVGAVERALEAVLPGPLDWQQGMLARYQAAGLPGAAGNPTGGPGGAG